MSFRCKPNDDIKSENQSFKAFGPEELREDIVKIWGPAGAHVDLFDMIINRLSQLSRELQKADQAKGV